MKLEKYEAILIAFEQVDQGKVSRLRKNRLGGTNKKCLIYISHTVMVWLVEVGIFVNRIFEEIPYPRAAFL